MIDVTGRMWETTLVCLFVGLILWYSFKKSKNLPPGPPTFPLIGSLLHMIKSGPTKPVWAFKKLGSVYGPIFYIKAGIVPMVVINDHKTINDMGAQHEYSDRIPFAWVMEKSYGLPIGLLMSRLDFWMETRTLAAKYLAKHGFNNKSTLEKHIMEVVKEFMEDFKEEVRLNDGIINFENQLNPLFYSTSWKFITNQKLSLKDPLLNKFIEITEEFTRSAKLGWGFAFLYPRVASIFSKFTGFAANRKNLREFQGIIENAVAERRLIGEYKTSPSNFIDDYLQQIDLYGGNNDNPLKNVLTDKNLETIMQDLILGGNATVANSTKFSIRYLIKHPEIQAKLREEVDTVVGRNRFVCVEDIPRLVYTQATMLETLRIVTPTPIMYRTCQRDTKIAGYDIPRETMVLLNLWTANSDESVWENPDEFKPERFLGPDGQIVNAGKVLSFGIGKRKCIADQFSKTTQILVTATLVQGFEFLLDPTSGKLVEETAYGATFDTVPFKTLVKVRDL